jgi:Bacterial Ig domain
LNPLRKRAPGRVTPSLVGLLAIALMGGTYYALVQTGQVRAPIGLAPTLAPVVVSAPTTVPEPPAAAATTIGWVDTPEAGAIVGTRIGITGWALDPAGILRVDVRVDGVSHAATYGMPRPDVAKEKPGFPDSARAGFTFEGDFADLPPQRHEIVVVAINRAGASEVLARKSLLPPAAMRMWSGLLEAHPALASRQFYFLMMTSGTFNGSADEIATAYAPYLSRTQRVGMAVPILYLRTTKGASEDWEFDPDFDIHHKCRDLTVADDNLSGLIRYAIAHQVPVQFILNGGIWADASCDIPAWDVNDALEQDDANVQWTAQNETFPDDYLKNLPGSSNSPELARTLTYNVYAAKVRHYKRRNLQAAARMVAQFARAHPDLFVGISLDADTYMNPFYIQAKLFKIFDYNPGMLRQFRHWLRGDGPYAGRPERDVPDLSKYRRSKPLTLAEVNALARKQWKNWDEVDPPRAFPGSPYEPAIPGVPIIWDDPWYAEWQVFRQHVIALHYDELSRWVHEAGIPTDRIFSAQGFIAPDAGNKPFALYIESRGKNFDTSGVSVEGSIPRYGHLGAVLYGETAENRTEMEGPHNLFAAFARMDPGWGVVEFNNTNLKLPKIIPDYDKSYRSFRDMFNYDARMVSPMAWNGSNGIFAGQPDYVAYTSWRNTPAEEAMKDFVVARADLPRGSRLWTFGAARYASDDDWSLDSGTLTAGPGFVDLRFQDAVATLKSPDDQVLRAATLDTLYLGLRDPDSLLTVEVHARIDKSSPWRVIAPAAPAAALARTPPGLAVPLVWPADWRARRTIAESLQIVLKFRAGVDHARVERIALYPRARIVKESQVRSP